MKTILLAAVLMLASNIFAQSEEKKDTTTVNRNINIEKEYIPEIQSAKRRNLNIKTQEPTINANDIRYSSYASSVQPRSNFYPLDPQTQEKLQREKLNNGFTELGIGYPLNWKAKLYYPIVHNKSTLFDIHLDHKGIYKGKRDMQLINTDFDIYVGENVNSSNQFYTEIGYGNSYYNYYGLTSETDSIEKQCIHEAEAIFGMRSTREMNGWEYNANLGYEFAYLQYIKNHEHKVDLEGEMSKMLGHNPLSIGLLMNFNYLANIKDFNSTIGLMPSYRILWKNLDLKIGAKIYFAIEHGRVVNAMPDVTLKYNIKKTANLYAGITGDYRINTLVETLKECRYFDFSGEGLEKNQYTPADFFLGFKIKPVTGFMIDLHANYKFIMDEHFIRNKFEGNTMTNLFTADYADMQHLNTGIRLNYNHKDKYVAHADVRYNYYKVESDSIMAWNRPTWEFETGVKMNPVKGLSLSADFYLGTGYFTATDTDLNTEKMNNHYDLNIGAAYTFKKQYTIFADINNLLGFGKLNYQDWYGYNNIGFNFLAGVKINF